MHESIQPTKNFADLISLVKILRSECPWDRKQTHESIKDNLIEEAYEAIEAIDHNDFEELKTELGDVLLHVVFHSRMATETGQFDIGDVIYTLQEKLIRRHPHVFGDVNAENEQQVAENWERIKMNETESRKSVLDGVPVHLPALIRAQRMQEKAANVGFDWPDSDTKRENIWAKISEELDEFKQAMETANHQQSREEFGDLLFSLVNLGRSCGFMAEDSLRLTNTKFQQRFEYIEQKVAQSGQRMNDVSLEKMDQYWQQAKSEN